MKRAFLALVVLIVAQAIVASISGRKIYGRPVVIDNRPLLKGSVLIDHLEAPNVVVTSTGDRLQVVGVVFEQWAIDSPARDLHEFFNDPDPIRICSDPKQPSGVAFEWKFRYWCGNTFFPRFFPKPLPRYEVADLGRGMVAGMLARDPSSVVRQADCILISFCRPRFTFSKMSRAEAVQTNGLGLELWAAR